MRTAVVLRLLLGVLLGTALVHSAVALVAPEGDGEGARHLPQVEAISTDATPDQLRPGRTTRDVPAVDAPNEVEVATSTSVQRDGGAVVWLLLAAALIAVTRTAPERFGPTVWGC